MSRSWGELLGDANGAPEPEETRSGFFGRLRDSLSKSRQALTAEISLAAFDPADDEAWERLEESLIMADVGVPATAELVRRLEARGADGDLGTALAEELETLLGGPGTLPVSHRPPALPGVGGTGR